MMSGYSKSRSPSPSSSQLASSKCGEKNREENWRDQCDDHTEHEDGHVELVQVKSSDLENHEEGEQSQKKQLEAAGAVTRGGRGRDQIGASSGTATNKESSAGMVQQEDKPEVRFDDDVTEEGEQELLLDESPLSPSPSKSVAPGTRGKCGCDCCYCALCHCQNHGPLPLPVDDPLDDSYVCKCACEICYECVYY